MMTTTVQLSSQQRRLLELARHGEAGPYRVRAVVSVHGALDAARLHSALMMVTGRLAGMQGQVDSDIERLSAGRARWIVSMPALLGDEPALRSLVEAVVDVYRGELVDDTALVSSALTYADYADWQATLMGNADTADARAYWADTRCPEPSRWVLPFARDIGRVPQFTPAVLTRRVDDVLTARLTTCARAAGVDLATWLFAAYQVLLWRHVDTADIDVGFRLDGRAHALLRAVPGPCARYVPVAAEIGLRSTLMQHVRRTAPVVRERRLWEECFDWNALERGVRDAGELPYHAFGFEWHRAERKSIGRREPGATTFTVTALTGTLDRFDIRLSARRSGRRLLCEFEWNSACYDERDVALVADRYLTLLADAARHPERAVTALEVVGAGEREHHLTLGRGIAAAAPVDVPVHTWCLQHSAIEQTRVAVIAGATRLTYDELDRRSAALAARLVAAGAAAGHRVAICLPRTADQLVAMCGVLRSGAAFVPLDPAVPWERLAWTVSDARVTALIAPADAAAAIPGDASVALLTPEHLAATEGEAAAPLPAVDPASPAYVIYTSGSTGRPKGVVVSHRNLVHSTQAREPHYRRPVGTFLLVSPLAFDSAMAGVFWTLASGGTLVLPGDDAHNDPAALRALVDEHHVTHLLCLPSLYSWLIDGEPLPALRSLQVAIVAGERCAAALVERHRRALPGVELHNEYGPTECSVWSTVYRADTSDPPANVPIGQPIARAALYVAERPWRLTPVGVAGEALVGGEGVADGYLHRPDLTAERFVPDAWSGRPGARAYRTGDRVRFRDDGHLEFLGRVDHQVKIRGYRIEPEEIEACIGAHPDVRECAVAVKTVGGSDRLVGYVVAAPAADGADPLPDRLRRYLFERLPLYMVPGTFVLADTLPKTPNGKVDRGRLPAPAIATGPPTHPPVTPTEMAVAALWAEALGREQVGIHDNFFDLGGHSLMAISIFARLRGRVPQLRLIDLFEHSTVHSLAAFVDATGAASAPAPAEAGAALAEESVAVAANARARQQALRRKRLEARVS